MLKFSNVEVQNISTKLKADYNSYLRLAVLFYKETTKAYKDLINSCKIKLEQSRKSSLN